MKAEILSILKKTDGFVSGQELCSLLGVSRTAIWKNIKKLQEEGYEIEAINRKGYRLVDMPVDAMTAAEIQSCLTDKTDNNWRYHVLYQDEVDSTNTWAKREAEAGAADGTVLVADTQTAGKGRRGRSWSSPSGYAAYMSIVLRPSILPERASMVTLVAGLSVASAIRSMGLEAKIKWPNDVVISGKKVCGILTEMSTQMEEINYLVLGIGINVNMTDFPEEIRDKATSICLESGKMVKRAELIAVVLRKFSIYYDKFLQCEDLSAIQDEYNSMLINCNRRIRVLQPENGYEGTSDGINEKGELLVTKDDGTQVNVYAGEVSVRGLYGYV